MAKEPIDRPPPLRVCTLLYNNLLATSATLPVEMLRTAEAADRAANPGTRSIVATTLSIDGQPITSPSGFAISPSATIDEIDHCDIISLPALWRNPRPALKKYRDYLPWLQRQVNDGATVIAVGTGVCFRS